MRLVTSMLTISASLFLSQAASANCTYEIDPQSVGLTWTGYKTPKKVGVSGTFSKLTVSNFQKAPSKLEALKGLNYEIDMSSTSSGDKVRDLRISTILFLGTKTVKGQFLKADGDKLIFSTTVNNVTKDISLTSKEEGDSLVAEGSFELLDFAINKNVAEFAKACAGRHEGKTWTDVNAKLSMKFKKTCK